MLVHGGSKNLLDFDHPSSSSSTSVLSTPSSSLEMSAPSKSSQESQKVTILGLDITHWTAPGQIVFLTLLVFLFYLCYGYLQELIFSVPGAKPHGWYLTFIQFLYYSVFGLVIAGRERRKIPMKMYFLLAFLTVSTMGLSNVSVGYLNYPTQVMFKSCKLIPVLIGGILIQGKVFSKWDWLACFAMSGGLVLFLLTDSEVSPNFDLYGIVTICLALVADACIGNVQEKTMKLHGASNSEVLLYSYGVGTVYLLCGLTASGDLIPSSTFFADHPTETYGYCLLFSITGYLGQNAVLCLVRQFGALVAVTITTVRKAVTIVFSFLLFTKPFSVHYLWGGLLFSLGVYLNLYAKNEKAWNQRMRSCVMSVLRRCAGSSGGARQEIV